MQTFKKVSLLILPFILIYLYGTYFSGSKNEFLHLCEIPELKDLDKAPTPEARTELLWAAIAREIKRPDSKELLLSFAHGGDAQKEDKLRALIRHQGAVLPYDLCPALKELVR